MFFLNDVFVCFSYSFFNQVTTYLAPSNNGFAPGTIFCKRSYPGTQIPTRKPTYRGKNYFTSGDIKLGDN